MLSLSVDAGALSQLTDPQETSLGFRAHMSLLKLDGAGTWLHAIPSEALGTKVEPQLYSVGYVCQCSRNLSFALCVMG